MVFPDLGRKVCIWLRLPWKMPGQKLPAGSSSSSSSGRGRSDRANSDINTLLYQHMVRPFMRPPLPMQKKEVRVGRVCAGGRV